MTLATDPARSTTPVDVDPLLTPAPRTDRGVAWTGTSVMIRHRPDGTVAASTRGLIAVGATEAEALAGLARLVRSTARR